MHKNGFLFVISLILLTGLVNSQPDSVYNFMIPSYRLYQKERGKEVFYEFENKWNLVTVTDSFFIADPNKYSYKVPVNNITKIGYHYGTNAGKLIVIMGGAGFALGLITLGYEIDFGGGGGGYNFGRAVFGGVILGSCLAILGGVIALVSGGYDIDEFKTNDKTLKRLKILRSLMKNRLRN